MNRKRIYIVVGAVLFALVLALLWPVKFAVTQPIGENYIVCRYQKTTDSNFYIIDEASGVWLEDIWVEKVSDFYSRRNHYDLYFMCQDNTFYLYGEFDGVTQDGDRIYKIERWDIKYPIKRGILNFFPFQWFLSNWNMFW